MAAFALLPFAAARQWESLRATGLRVLRRGLKDTGFAFAVPFGLQWLGVEVAADGLGW